MNLYKWGGGGGGGGGTKWALVINSEGNIYEFLVPDHSSITKAEDDSHKQHCR